MTIHKLLARQLEKLSLCEDALPTDLDSWKLLLSRIHKSYLEADQERYLIERAMDISSREMMGINAQLERAQYIAHLCYWEYAPNGLLSWSKGIYDLLQLDEMIKPPTFAEFIDLIHPESRGSIQKAFEAARVDSIDFDFEIRVRTQKDGYKWFRIIIKHSAVTSKPNELSGVLKDINDTKSLAIEIEKLNKSYVLKARQAGMSEVATAILHNVGNILNSVNVSVATLKTNIMQNSRH